VQSPRQACGCLEAVFFTWETHRRARGLASRLGLRLHEIAPGGNRICRYARQVLSTLRLLQLEAPALVFVQNPSIVLTVLVLLWRAAASRNARVIIDAHNEAITPYVHDYWIVRWLARWAIRRADFTVVTNSRLAAKVRTIGGVAIVLPDPLPSIQSSPPNRLVETRVAQALVIATFARDEPIASLLEAAGQFHGSINFRFTGNARKLAARLIQSAPANVEFLGYLPEDRYWLEMRQCDVVIDLTQMEDCLVCGAYEAVAVGRPMILSNSEATREYFSSGAIYSAGDTSSISFALSRLRPEYDRLAQEVQSLREALAVSWGDRSMDLIATVQRASQRL